jgi:hypothetical protein
MSKAIHVEASFLGGDVARPNLRLLLAPLPRGVVLVDFLFGTATRFFMKLVKILNPDGVPDASGPSSISGWDFMPPFCHKENARHQGSPAAAEQCEAAVAFIEKFDAPIQGVRSLQVSLRRRRRDVPRCRGRPER